MPMERGNPPGTLPRSQRARGDGSRQLARLLLRPLNLRPAAASPLRSQVAAFSPLSIRFRAACRWLGYSHRSVSLRLHAWGGTCVKVLQAAFKLGHFRIWLAASE